MKYHKNVPKNCKISPLVITLLSLTLLSLLVVTKDITLIAKITLRWPHFQAHQNQALDLEQLNDREIQALDLEPLSDQENETVHPEQKIIPPPLAEDEEEEEEEGIGLCDLSKGKWIFDKVTRPLYKEEECGWLTAQVTCVRNGREDRDYQKWRWQPHDCSLPKFEARKLLEKLRGKRVLFVGDSLNRNQWESMVCLLQTGIRPGKATWKMGAPFSVFSVQDYNATIEFYWSPFLVESNSDDPRNHSISQRIINPESISKHGIHWKDADFLVFNTYIWWMNSRTIKVLRGSSDQGSSEYDEIERPTAYERVLTTWANWIKHNVDHNRTSAFFISMSPVHQQYYKFP